MSILFRALPVFLSALLLVPLIAQGQIQCGAVLAPVEKMICGDYTLRSMDEQLGKTYGLLRGSAANQGELAGEQRQWLVSVRDRCTSTECLANAYGRRTQDLYSRLLAQIEVHGDMLSNAEAKNACVELAALADDKRLSKLALWGRQPRQFEPAREQDEWTVSDAEAAKLEARSRYHNNEPWIVHRLRLKSGAEPVRFASFWTGGSCSGSTLLNLSHVINLSGEDDGIDEVPDPDDELRWTRSGGRDYPIVHRGRNFVVTHADADANTVRLISWIKPNGRIRPICLLDSNRTKRVSLPNQRAPLCQGIAAGTLRPLSWKAVTDDLPLQREPATYQSEFVKRYGRYAEGVELRPVDLNGDGMVDNIARFSYASGSGCGANLLWLGALSKDMGSLAPDSLNTVLKTFEEGPMNIYAFKGKYFFDTAVSVTNDALISLQGNRPERVCELEWQTRTKVKSFFEVET